MLPESRIFLTRFVFCATSPNPEVDFNKQLRNEVGFQRYAVLQPGRNPTLRSRSNCPKTDRSPIGTRLALLNKFEVTGNLFCVMKRYGGMMLWLLDRPDAQDDADELRLTQTHLEQISANAAFRPISRFFESIRYLHVVPQLVRHPESFQGPATPEDTYGRNFLEMVAKTPEKTRESRLRRITALHEAVPQLTKLTDTKDEAGIPHLEVIYEHWRPNAGRQREDQFSDGTIRLIGLFWSLLEGEAPLLLEEPELSLHSAIIRKLPGLFAKLQRKRKRQLFIRALTAEICWRIKGLAAKRY